MVLGQDRPEPGGIRVEQRLVVIENARHRGRTAVAVQIHRAF